MPVEITEKDSLMGRESDPKRVESTPAPVEPAMPVKNMARSGGVQPSPSFGVYPALVVDIADPDEMGRVKVRLPWAVDPEGTAYEAWARIATLMAGNNRGTWFIPDVGDEVLVAFEAGDPRRPYVVGALWNGQDAPPETMDGGGHNFVKTIRSRQGVKLVFDDTERGEKLSLETPGGQVIHIDDGANKVLIQDKNGNMISMEPTGITVTASAKVTVQASMVEVSAGVVTVNSGMSKFSGVVQCDTLITNSVISSSYTPGAGNIW